MNWTSDNIVMGSGFGYSDETMLPFLSSLRRTGYGGQIIILCDDNTSTALAEQFAVTFMHAKRFQSAGMELPLNARRFFLYRSFFNDTATNGFIMLSDVRDVLFQKQPFDFPQLARYDLCYAMEERAIGDCNMNSKWIASRFGVGILRKLHGEIISCAGTVFGNLAGIRSYLRKMCEHLHGSSDTYGLDQGVHNLIIHLDKVDNQRALLNGLGPIMTMHYMNLENISFDENGAIKNYNNSIPNILHQYDRLPHVYLHQLLNADARRSTNR